VLRNCLQGSKQQAAGFLTNNLWPVQTLGEHLCLLQLEWCRCHLENTLAPHWLQQGHQLCFDIMSGWMQPPLTQIMSSLGRQPPTWGTLVSCCRGYPGTVSVLGHTQGYPEPSPRVPGWAGRAGVGVPAAYLPGRMGGVWQGVWIGCWLCLGMPVKGTPPWPGCCFGHGA
jgi:hypothetical protein